MILGKSLINQPHPGRDRDSRRLWYGSGSFIGAIPKIIPSYVTYLKFDVSEVVEGIMLASTLLADGLILILQVA